MLQASTIRAISTSGGSGKGDGGCDGGGSVGRLLTVTAIVTTPSAANSSLANRLEPPWSAPVGT